jgi:hypothetical protein
VIAAATGILAQCEGLIRDLPDSAYTGVSRVLDGGTVGKHLRHTLDHYRAIVRAVREGGVIDYDRREREVPMERDRQAALDEVGAVLRGVRALMGAGLDRGVTVRVMVSESGEELLLASTLAREVAFATHHAVHHLAMIKSIAGEFGCVLSRAVGRAPSTLNHEKTSRR